MMRLFTTAAVLLSAVLLAACAGGAAGSSGDSSRSSSSGGSSSSSSSGGSSSSSSGGGSSSSSSSGGSSSSSSGGGSSAAQLAAKLGKPARFLVGIGTQGNADIVTAVKAQALTPDIFDEYLVGAGAGDWTTWNSPAGAYVGIVQSQAESMGAVPMYTLYQMATNGDGNVSGLNSTAS